jgi:hypothetical protein
MLLAILRPSSLVSSLAVCTLPYRMYAFGGGESSPATQTTIEAPHGGLSADEYLPDAPPCWLRDGDGAIRTRVRDLAHCGPEKPSGFDSRSMAENNGARVYALRALDHGAALASGTLAADPKPHQRPFRADYDMDMKMARVKDWPPKLLIGCTAGGEGGIRTLDTALGRITV